jgi:hypothetical protein
MAEFRFPVPDYVNEALHDDFDQLVVSEAIGGGYVFTYSGSQQNPGLYCSASGLPFDTVEAAKSAAFDTSDSADLGEYDGDIVE